jgi:hypothetical protein
VSADGLGDVSVSGLSKFDGNDFIILGLVLGVGGALLFGKAYLMPEHAAEVAETYVGGNPFQVRNTIITRHEAIAGAVWLIAGLLFSLIGIVRSVRAAKVGYLISSSFDIVVLLAAALVFWRVTVAVTDRTSRAEYLPVMSTMMRESFSTHSFVLLHGGPYRQDKAQGLFVSPEVANQRVTHGRDALDRIAKLFDEPRMTDESDTVLIERLAKFFPGVSLE